MTRLWTGWQMPFRYDLGHIEEEAGGVWCYCKSAYFVLSFVRNRTTHNCWLWEQEMWLGLEMCDCCYVRLVYFS